MSEREDLPPMPLERDLSELLYRIGAVRFGEFVIKDRRVSPYYLDLRVLVSYPDALARVGRAVARHAEHLQYDRLAGIPYAGLPIAVAASLINGRPLIYARKEAKGYGTRQRVEGEFRAGDRVLVIDDVITSGGAKLEAIEPLRAAELQVADVLVVVDREDRGAAALANVGLHLHSVLKVRTLLNHLREAGVIDDAQIRRALDFVSSHI